MSVESILRRHGLDPEGNPLPAEKSPEVTWQQEQEAFDAVRPVVLRVARRYCDYVDADDVGSEVWVWWLGEGRKYVLRYIAEGELGKLGRAAYGKAVTFCEKEKAARSGYRPEDNIVYSKQQIKDLIPLALDLSAFAETTPTAVEGPHAKGNLAEGGNLLASVVDVRIAVSKLAVEDRDFLHAADACHYTWEDIADLYEIQADSADQRFDRIAGRIARNLSREAS